MPKSIKGPEGIVNSVGDDSRLQISAGGGVNRGEASLNISECWGGSSSPLLDAS